MECRAGLYHFDARSRRANPAHSADGAWSDPRPIEKQRSEKLAIAAAGQRGVSHLLDLFASDMRVTMTLIGAKSVHEITRDNLALVEKELAAQGKDRRSVGDAQSGAE